MFNSVVTPKKSKRSKKMQRKKLSNNKNVNLILVLTLFFSLIGPTAYPLSVYADSETETTTTVVEDSETTEAAQDSVDGFELAVMHMNDTHSRVENYTNMITGIKDYRQVHPEALLLHAGDVFSGTLYFNEFKGKADLALLNMMEFDAMVFGNHEFDLGKSAEGHQALSYFVENANFPLLGTNSDFTGDENLEGIDPQGSAIRDPEAGKAYNSIVVERENEEIGIFGLTTEDTENIASPVKVTFSNYVEAAEAEIQKLEAEGINKIIAVTHLGYDSAPAVGNDLLLAKYVEGIDVIVGGHSHTALKEPDLVQEDEKAPTVIVQAGQYAEHLGTVEVTFDEQGEVIAHSGKLIPVATRNESTEQDEEALKVLKPYKEAVDKLSNEKIGAVAQKDLINPRAKDPSEQSVRANETALGNLVTDAMLAKAKEKEPDTLIALQNGGGIRESIEAGPITVGEVISVLPFGNDPVVAELTGKEIKDILEHAVHKAPEENGGFLHTSGMKFSYDSEKEVGNRVVKMFLVDEDGKETVIDPEGNLTYKVTTNGFTGQGGDGFDTFKTAYENGRVRDIGEIDWQQLRDYMAEEQYLNGIVNPVMENRITDLYGERTGAKVEQLITELPETSKLTLEDKSKVEAAREAYDNLTYEGRKYVESLDKLEASEDRMIILGRKGWVEIDSDWYYYNNDHTVRTGWTLISHKWYYMNKEGKMQTGWQKLDHTWFYMDASGAMQKGWTKVDDTWYYMNSNGSMRTDWTKVGNTWYYMSSSGAMQTGWKEIKDTWYYMDSSGAMQTGWVKVGNTWYYMNSNGAMQTGWKKLNDTWYYMNSSGAMQTGWEKVNGTWYYMASNGAMQTGWVQVGNTWYYMADNGAMQTGWLKLGDNWYYLNTNGSMQRQNTTINSRWYRFHSSGRIL